MTKLIQDAVYLNIHTGDLFKLLGLKRKTVVIHRCDEEGNRNMNYDFEEATHDDFHEYFVDYGVHNHETACCDEHDTHTTLHMGCLLR